MCLFGFIVLIISFLHFQPDVVSMVEYEQINTENAHMIAMLNEVVASELSLITDIDFNQATNRLLLRNRRESQTVEIWSVNETDIELIQTIQVDQGTIWQTQFSVSGNFIALNTEEAIYIWQIGFDEVFKIIDSVSRIVMHPTEDILAYTSTENNYISIWRLSHSEMITQFAYQQPTYVAFDARGQFLFVGSKLGSIAAISLDENFAGLNAIEVMGSNGGSVMEISPISENLILFSAITQDGRTIGLWNVEQQKNETLDEPIYEASYLDAEIVFQRLDDRVSFQFWDIVTGDKLIELSELGSLVASVNPDNSIIAVSELEYLNLYDLKTSERLVSVPCTGACFSQFSKDGTILFLWGDDATVQIWGVDENG